MRAKWTGDVVACLLQLLMTSAAVEPQDGDVLNGTATTLQPPVRCSLGFDPGRCTSKVHKWFYNSTAGACRTFIYGGCDGNGNRFDSEVECLHTCVGGEYTLPPYLRQASPEELLKEKAESKSTTPAPLKFPVHITAAPVPLSERGAELTFEETGHHTVFMFAQTNTYIQVDRIPGYQLRLCREMSFEFRTRLPHGLLLYHSVKEKPGDSLDPYALYVIVENGQLKVVHVFGKQSTSVTVGAGLNDDVWHSVLVRIDVHRALLLAKVDNQQQEGTSIRGLNPDTNYGVTTDLTSVVLIGGLSSEEKLHGVKYIIESFVGCIKSMVLSAGKAASDLLPIKPLVATKHENIIEGCIDRCKTLENLCFVGSKCVNHYNGLTCDCFGRWYEGERCDIYTATVLTLRGSSYVSYRVYDWKDRVHTRNNRISLFFKTRFDDSALFYASGEPHGRHFIAVSVKNHSVFVQIHFGHGSPISLYIGERVTDNYWNNLTIAHNANRIRLSLNNEVNELIIPGATEHLYIDPEIYIGGGPELHKKTGLASNNNFAGSLKYVFFNDVSILYELKKVNPKVHYIGVLEPEFREVDIEMIPITFPFPSSKVWWFNDRMDSMNFKFDFKCNRSLAVLASCDVSTPTVSHGYWEVRVVNDEIRFELMPDSSKNVTHLTTVKFNNSGGWHSVELLFSKRELKLSVDYKSKAALLSELQFQMTDRIVLGGGNNINNIGLVGCMRQIIINGVSLDPRYLVRTQHSLGDVSLDNCQLVDPCQRPNACEHGGICLVQHDKIMCDCKETGYIGNNCHFAEFRKTCEELALLGYTKPDVYLIDIDGNGRFPPAHVKCEFQSLEDSTKTIVEHNLPSQVDVRSSVEEDFSFTIRYREFSSEMIQELVSHSLRCSQHLRYDCYKAPLELHSATWFVSSASATRGDIVDHVGDTKRGVCPCAANKTCVDPTQACNCDVSEAKWRSDEGYYTTPAALGIIQMVFLQQRNLEPDAIGRITLGPLECVETNTQKYVVTFTSSQSYIEVPGWRKGDISFSFRTTGEKAILLYQPPIRPLHPSFMVALTNDFQLTFNFTLNTGESRELEVKSRRRLNNGEWQKIWIDYNEYHVRFMINTDYQMLDLTPEEEFGPFEGSMFIGGATQSLLKKSTVRQGLIGCFRGLVVNGEILDIYSYMSVHLSEIIQDCKPSCDPNPCKNGAKCLELWSSFRCLCTNPWAHIGTYCETNINANAITFLTQDSYVKRNFLGGEIPENANKAMLSRLLTHDVLLNLRTYDTHALIFYANDHVNNFVQLHLEGGRRMVFTFNSGRQIRSVTVEYTGLNSGRSMQVVIQRSEFNTTLHVNENNTTVSTPLLLLEKYSNRPWENPEQEILAPQRPPAPPTEYFQVNIGGFDPAELIAGRPEQPMGGYVGCIRGFKVASQIVDLASQVGDVTDGSAVPGCNMKCDGHPCKNQGVCIEDFQKGLSSCRCDHSSYYGEFCDEEKGTDFGGESMLQRKYQLKGPVNQVKVQLAFSSSDLRQRNTALLLLQTESTRGYFLLVALTMEGHLIFEECRDEGGATGVKMTDRNFLNGARHSVFYERNNGTAMLLIDRDEVLLVAMPVLSLTEDAIIGRGLNEVQVGGVNTTDQRFAGYKNYNGCLSNVFVQVNNQGMKPLEEYMLFTKTGSEKVNVQNAAGVRIAQCAFFDVINKPRPGQSLNISQGRDKAWMENPPGRDSYKSLYSDTSTEEDGSTRVIFLVLTALFLLILTGSLFEVFRSHRNSRMRRRESDTILWANNKPSTCVTYSTIPQQDIMKNKSPKTTTPMTEIAKTTPDIKKNNGHQPAQAADGDPRHNIEPKHVELSPPVEVSSVKGCHTEKQVGLNGDTNRFPPIPEDDIDFKDISLIPGPMLSPVFLTQQSRGYCNPLSYLGGPRIDSYRGASKESILSLD